MNPLCFFCDAPATRVCCYQNCKQLAFLCSGPCIKSASERIHNHDDDITYFIKCSQVEQRLIELGTTPQSQGGKDHKIKKYIELLKNQLDKLEKAYSQALQTHIKLAKTKKAELILQKPLSRLSGSQINYLMSEDQNIYANILETKFMFKQYQRIHKATLQSIENILSQHKNKIETCLKKSCCEICLEDNIFVLNYVSSCPCSRLRNICYGCVKTISTTGQYFDNLCQKCNKSDLNLQKKINGFLEIDNKQFYQQDKIRKLQELTNPTVCPNCRSVFEFSFSNTTVGKKSVGGVYCKCCQTYFYNCCLAPLSPIESHCSEYHRQDCTYHKYFKHYKYEASPTCSECKKLPNKQQCIPPGQTLSIFLAHGIGKQFYLLFCEKLRKIAINKRIAYQRTKEREEYYPYEVSMLETEHIKQYDNPFQLF